MKSLFNNKDESMSEDSLENAIARLVYAYLVDNNKSERYINWKSVETHLNRIHHRIKMEHIEAQSNQRREEMREKGWITSGEVGEILGSDLYDFIRRNELLTKNNLRMYNGDSHGTDFYKLEDVNDKEKIAEIRIKFLASPHYSTHQAAEKLGITTAKFLSLAKKIGIEPADHYFSRNGRGNLYSINQFNEISEFYKNPNIQPKQSEPTPPKETEQSSVPASFDELLSGLGAELAELQERRANLDKQGRSSTHLGVPISGILNRIAEVEKFQYVLPELSQRLRAWRGNRGLREVANILESEFESDFGQELSGSTISRIEQGYLNKRTDFIEWLENYLIAHSDTYSFELQKEAQFNDFPLFTTYQAAEKLGISAQTFLTWAKKAGVKKPAGKYPTKNGLGYLYSINQFNAISEFYKQSKK